MAKGKGQLKLPKRLLGVKVPKKERKNLNALLRSVPSSEANPLVGAVVGSIVTLIAERLEPSLRALIESRLPADNNQHNEKTRAGSFQAHH